MAVRIRKNGDIVCAAMNKEEKGDIYVGDELHYHLSAERKVLVTEPMAQHKKSGGRWWFINEVPKGIEIDEFYSPLT